MEYFVERDDVEALCALLHVGGRDELRAKAWQRLHGLDVQRARRCVFDLVKRMEPHERIALLMNVAPQTGEDTRWNDFAESTTDLLERLVRQVQGECAASDLAAGWGRTRSTLAVLDAVNSIDLDDPETVMGELRDAHGPWVPDGLTMEEVRGPLVEATEALLSSIAVTLLQARALKRGGIGEWSGLSSRLPTSAADSPRTPSPTGGCWRAMSWANRPCSTNSDRHARRLRVMSGSRKSCLWRDSSRTCGP